MLCEAQQNFAKSTQVLENKIEDKSVFLAKALQKSSKLKQVQAVGCTATFQTDLDNFYYFLEG